MRLLTSTISAGLSAALISYYVNAKALRAFGEKSITYGAPVFEEILKTGLAVLLGGYIIGSHVVFGSVEALYDLSKDRGASSIYACIVGFISHAIFGIITVYVFRNTSVILWGVAAAAAVHMLWNYLVMTVSKARAQ